MYLLLISDIQDLNGEVITIFSPHYPDKYSNNAYYLWTIQAPTDLTINCNIIYIDLEHNRDYIYIVDSTDNYSNNSEKWVRISGSLRDNWNRTNVSFHGSTILMIFTSDGKTTGGGFRIDCRGTKSDTESITTTKIYKHTNISTIQGY